MVSDAERYKQEDEEATARIAARNGLEGYAYNLRNSIQDDKLKAQWDANGADKATLQTAVDEAIHFVESSAEASKAEYEERQKELEGEFFSLFLLSSDEGECLTRRRLSSSFPPFFPLLLLSYSAVANPISASYRSTFPLSRAQTHLESFSFLFEQ